MVSVLSELTVVSDIRFIDDVCFLNALQNLFLLWSI